MAFKATLVLALLAAAVSSISGACPITTGGTNATAINTAINSSTLNTTCQTDACGSCLCNLTTIFYTAFQAANVTNTVTNGSNVNVSSVIAPVISACVANWTTQLTATGANATILTNAGQCSSGSSSCLATLLQTWVAPNPPSGSNPPPPPPPSSPAPGNGSHNGAGVAGVTVMGLLSAVSLAAMLL